MRTTSKNCFSNGTEHMIWTSNNCDLCWKHSKAKKDGGYTALICAIDDDIQTQIGGSQEISQRSYDITQLKDCPYRQLSRPTRRRRKKEDKNQGKLF